MDNNKNDSEKQILSIFKIVENQPCMGPREKCWTYHFDHEMKLPECNYVKGKKYDFRYEKIKNYITSKYQVFEENSILEFYPERDNDVMMDENLVLFARNFIGFDYNNELEEFTSENIKYYQILSNNCNTAMKGFSSFSYAMIAVDIIIILVYYEGRIQLEDLYLSTECNYNKAYIYTMIGLNFVSLLANQILSIIMIPVNHRLIKFVSLENTDEYTKEVIQIIYLK